MRLASVLVALHACLYFGCAGAAAPKNLGYSEAVKQVDANEPQYDYYILTPLGGLAPLDNYLDEKKFPLTSLLTTGAYKGILLLYILPADVWGSMLKYVPDLVKDKAAVPPKDVQDLFDGAEKYRQGLVPALKDERRVRILTPLDLKEELLSIAVHLGNVRFQKWFGQVTYDAPKIAGWIARIRGLGNDVPVVRLDEGVIFNFHAVGNEDGVRTLVEGTVKDYRASILDTFTQSFMISQQYSGIKANNGTIPFDTWNEAYATQACCVLLATKEMCDEKQFEKPTFPQNSHLPTGDQIQSATSHEVMVAFYGLDDGASPELKPFLEAKMPSEHADDLTRREEDATNMGITYVGGNPTHSLISGAALTTGPGVALDMPPMIHTDLFIMWIDDHLFDRMTAEVLSTKRRAPPNGGAGTKARFPDVRPPQRNPARFVLEFYMPTLTMGAIFDKWINDHPDAHLLKFRGETLPEKVRPKLAALKPASGEAMGPFTRAMQKVRFMGRMLEDDEVEKLSADLWKAALLRMQDVYWLWSRLPQPKRDAKETPSFATLWVTGRVCKHPKLEKYCSSDWAEVSKPCKGKFCVAAAQGMVKEAWDTKAKTAKTRSSLPPLSKTDLNPAFQEKVSSLIETAKHHLMWTADWPAVVQAIRTVPMGQVRSDTEFKSKYLEELPIWS